MEIWCEIKDFCKCYLSDDKEIIFEMNACGYDVKYILSGHPYEPVLYADCDNPRYSFRIHGGRLWFPHVPDQDDKHSEEWQEFCKELSLEITLRVAWLHNLPDEYRVDFSLLKKQGMLLFRGHELMSCELSNQDTNSPYLEPALFVERCNLGADVKTVYGGFPGENYIMISDLTAEQKISITTLDGRFIINQAIDESSMPQSTSGKQAVKKIETETTGKTLAAYFSDIYNVKPFHYECTLGQIKLPWNNQIIDIFTNHGMKERYRPVVDGLYAEETSGIYLEGDSFSEHDLTEYVKRVQEYNAHSEWIQSEKKRVLSEAYELIKKSVHPSLMPAIKSLDMWLLIYSGEYALGYDPETKLFSIEKYYAKEPFERRYWWWNKYEDFRTIESDSMKKIVPQFIKLVKKDFQEMAKRNLPPAIINILKSSRLHRFNKPANPKDIVAFETTNNIKLSEDFKTFLLISDGGELYIPAGVQIYGVTHRPIMDIHNDDCSGDTYIVIGRFPDGDPVLLKKNSKQVSIYNIEKSVFEDDEVYGDFYEFLNDLKTILGYEE